MPRLETPRLVLRPPEYSDAPAFARHLCDYEVAKNLASVPHPYGLADAQDFVSRVSAGRARGESFAFTILFKEDGAVLGCCGLDLRKGIFDLGYWIGRPYWGMGIATEAARRLISFAFNGLKADRLSAGWFTDNPVSGRVLSKLGFAPAGVMPYSCRARGAEVACNRMALSRAGFGRKQAA